MCSFWVCIFSICQINKFSLLSECGFSFLPPVKKSEGGGGNNVCIAPPEWIGTAQRFKEGSGKGAARERDRHVRQCWHCEKLLWTRIPGHGQDPYSPKRKFSVGSLKLNALCFNLFQKYIHSGEIFQVDILIQTHAKCLYSLTVLPFQWGP